MAGLWRNAKGTREGKYLVMRRDGTVPEWMWFVLGDRDMAAPAALRAYADKAEELGYDPQYVSDVRALAVEFEEAQATHGPGDPDKGKHRKDDPNILALMRREENKPVENKEEVLEKPKFPGLTIGRMVHYINHNQRHCAAVVVDVHDKEEGDIALYVLPYDPTLLAGSGSLQMIVGPTNTNNPEGYDNIHTWHYIERED